MSNTDDMVRHSEEFAATFDLADLPRTPARHVAVVACMDARLNLYRLLGLRDGDAHLIRNAGGVVTADVIRSLAISQRLAGTRAIVLVHHTNCAMLGITDDGFRRQLRDEVGMAPEWSPESFGDVEEDVRQSVARVKASPFIPWRDDVRGFVYDVTTGELREVT